MAKFNEDTCKCLVENHGKGLPIKDCADIAGISRQTVYEWMRKGESAKRGKYRDFYLDMQRARANFKAHHLQKISNSKSWMASQYLLQCVDPDEFVVAEKQKIESETKATIEANVDMNDPRIQANDLAMLKELISDKDGNQCGGDSEPTE